MEELKVRIHDIEKRLLVMDKERSDISADVKVLTEKIDSLIERIDKYVLHEKNSMFVRKDECNLQIRRTETFMNRIIGAIIIASFIITILVKFL